MFSNGEKSNYLRQADVKILTNNACSSKFVYAEINTKTQVAFKKYYLKSQINSIIFKILK